MALVYGSGIRLICPRCQKHWRTVDRDDIIPGAVVNNDFSLQICSSCFEKRKFEVKIRTSIKGNQESPPGDRKIQHEIIDSSCLGYKGLTERQRLKRGMTYS